MRVCGEVRRARTERLKVGSVARPIAHRLSLQRLSENGRAFRSFVKTFTAARTTGSRRARCGRCDSAVSGEGAMPPPPRMQKRRPSPLRRRTLFSLHRFWCLGIYKTRSALAPFCFFSDGVFYKSELPEAECLLPLRCVSANLVERLRVFAGSLGDYPAAQIAAGGVARQAAALARCATVDNYSFLSHACSLDPTPPTGTSRDGKTTGLKIVRSRAEEKFFSFRAAASFSRRCALPRCGSPNLLPCHPSRAISSMATLLVAAARIPRGKQSRLRAHAAPF